MTAYRETSCSRTHTKPRPQTSEDLAHSGVPQGGPDTTCDWNPQDPARNTYPHDTRRSVVVDCARNREFADKGVYTEDQHTKDLDAKDLNTKDIDTKDIDAQGRRGDTEDLAAETTGAAANAVAAACAGEREYSVAAVFCDSHCCCWAVWFSSGSWAIAACSFLEHEHEYKHTNVRSLHLRRRSRCWCWRHTPQPRGSSARAVHATSNRGCNRQAALVRAGVVAARG